MLHTLESGSAENPAVVFLHGGGLSARMWRPVIERLPGFYCLAPDLPEHGLSRDIAPFTLEDAARRTADIITRRAPGGRAHIVGLSIGGAVALTLARLAPEVVGRVMVSGTAAGVGKFLGGLSLASLWMLRLYKPETLAAMSARQWNIPKEYQAEFIEDLRAASTVEFNRTMIRSLMEMRLPEALPEPLLATVGAKETITAKQAARKLVRLYPRAVGRVVPNMGHVWVLEDPDLFAAAARAWILDAPLPEQLTPL